MNYSPHCNDMAVVFCQSGKLEIFPRDYFPVGNYVLIKSDFLLAGKKKLLEILIFC